jgi:hypothetical protein
MRDEWGIGEWDRERWGWGVLENEVITTVLEKLINEI